MSNWEEKFYESWYKLAKNEEDVTPEDLIGDGEQYVISEMKLYELVKVVKDIQDKAYSEGLKAGMDYHQKYLDRKLEEINKEP